MVKMTSTKLWDCGIEYYLFYIEKELTAAVLVAEIREPPNIREVDSKTDDWQEEVDFSWPGFSAFDINFPSQGWRFHYPWRHSAPANDSHMRNSVLYLLIFCFVFQLCKKSLWHWWKFIQYRGYIIWFNKALSDPGSEDVSLMRGWHVSYRWSSTPHSTLTSPLCVDVAQNHGWPVNPIYMNAGKYFKGYTADKRWEVESLLSLAWLSNVIWK